MRRYEIVVLGACLVIGLALRLFFFSGTLGNDDLRHAYHAYFLFQPDSVKHADIYWPEDTIFRRMGVNLPLWMSMRVFGVHEWSLALPILVFSLGGIVAIFALLRTLAGPAAGLAGAAMWACLPVDVYLATLWLQDNIFSTLLALLLLCLVSLAQALGRSRILIAIVAGMIVGYMQYTKESAVILLGPIAIWSLYKILKSRRLDWSFAHVMGGWVLLHGLMGFLFWKQGGHAWYWQSTALVVTRSQAHPHPPPQVLHALWTRLFDQWLLGFAAVVLPFMVVLALTNRRLPHRPLLGMMLFIQLFAVYAATRMSMGQDRYMQQLTVLFIVFSVLGWHTLLSRLQGRGQRYVTAVAYSGLVLMTGLALNPERQQHGRSRTESLRRAYTFIQDSATENDKIYLFSRPGRRRAGYTARALYQFNGFKRLKGGFDTIEHAQQASSGWVVTSYLDRRFMEDAGVQISDQWLPMYTPGGDRWTRVYKIMSPAARATIHAEDQKLQSFPENKSSVLVSVKGSRNGGGGRVISVGETIKVEVQDNEPPNWILIGDSRSTIPEKGVALSQGPRGGVSLKLRVRTSLPAEIKLGVVAESQNGLAGVPSVTRSYSKRFKVGNEFEDVEYTAQVAQNGPVYILPVIRTYPPAAYQIEIKEFELVAKHW